MTWQIMDWLAFSIGAVIVLSTFRSVVSTIIVPRPSTSKLSFRVWQAVHGAYMLLLRPFRSYEAQDSILTSLAPVTLLTTLAAWIGMFLIGYALMFAPFVTNIGTAFWLSGSSIFTLGVASSGQPGPIALEFLAAATGLIIVALQIGYLPSIYGAYNRRETLVTALSSRAGDPAWGPEILARHQLDGTLSTLGGLYAAWETWAADIAESHCSYPWLIVFRSPDPLYCWATSLLAVLDSAALYLALAPEHAPLEARQFIRMGFVGMRRISHIIGAPVNDDPLPDDPIHLTYEQFALGVDHLRRVGFPMDRSTEEAWRHFHGWRVNYETAAYALAAFVIAVPAPWSGERPTMATRVIDVLAHRPVHRSPNDPDGARVRQLGIRPEVEA